MDKSYPQGSQELLTLIEQGSFDAVVAENTISMMESIDQPILGISGYSTTLLYEAQDNNNIEAVKYLLEHGADPNQSNLDLICDTPLWHLQYLDSEFHDPDVRLEIAKLFLEFGGDPNLLCEGETLFEYIVYKVFNEMSEPDWEYIKRFYILLLAYGGGKEYLGDKISSRIDKSKLNSYDISFQLCDDGYHIRGYLVDSGGVILGEL